MLFIITYWEYYIYTQYCKVTLNTKSLVYSEKSGVPVYQPHQHQHGQVQPAQLHSHAPGQAATPGPAYHAHQILQIQQQPAIVPASCE